MAKNKNILVTMYLRDQVTGSSKKIEGSLSSVRRQLTAMEGDVKKASGSFSSLTMSVLKAAPAFAVATAAITGVYTALRAVRDEFTGGLKAVEDYNLAVATMAGFMTSFSKQAREGDLSGAFQQSIAYSETLIERLEVLDAKTVATGKDLTLMAQSFIKQGVQIDLALEGTEEGVVNIANALILLTAGQNKTKQIMQEIRGLMSGQDKAQNSLLRLLKAQNPLILEQLEMWKAQGTVIPNLGRELAGMGKASSLIEKTWEAIGSTMSTIHTKVLRAGFRPVYEDLLGLATDLNEKFFENGEVTEYALGVVEKIHKTWIGIKTTVSIINTLLKESGLGEFVNLLWETTKAILDGWTQIAILFDETLSFLTKGFNEFTTGLYNQFKLIGETIWSALTFSLNDDKRAELDRRFREAGELVGNAFGESLSGNIEKKLNEYLRKPSGQEAATAVPLVAGGDAAEEVKVSVNKIDKALRDFFNSLDKASGVIKDKVASTIESMRTPLEIYIDRIKELDFLLTAGLPQETHNRAVNAAKEEFQKGAIAAQTYTDELSKTEEFIKNFSETTAGRIENTFSDLWSRVLSGTASWKDAMASLFNELSTELMRLMFFRPIAKAISGGFGDLLSIGSAQGNVFAHGVAGYSNQVVDKPTIFPFAKGVGLMGEKGPEAIMPLTRTPSGDLGVKAEGGGGTTNNYYVNAIDAQSVAQFFSKYSGLVGGAVSSELQSGNMHLSSSIKRTL